MLDVEQLIYVSFPQLYVM